MARRKSLPELPIESPIPFHTGSNGEFFPRPKSDRDARAEALFRRVSEEKAKRLGVSRRQFVESACGTATALWVINAVYACGGDEETASTSGPYDVDAGTTEDSGLACDKLSSEDFVFDVQTHHVNPAGAWRETAPGWSAFFASLPQGACGERDAVDCFDSDHYLREMFVNSDTHVAVLSAVPADPGANPLTIEEARATRDLVDKLSDSPRLVIHGLVLPERGASELDAMQALAEEMKIAAWKVYTPFNSETGGGWRLDDEAIGIPFLEKVQSLGVKLVCAHKGLPLSGFDPAFAAPDDIGVVAKAFPDLSFLVYHSAFDTAVTEGPYDPAGTGIDRLIKTVLDNEIGPAGNVYAELGSTWRFLMTQPDQAQHAIGKLLKHLGEDRIVWGTDSIWYGSPQDQIDAFRTFQISAELREAHGYPEITPAIRAKILGLNAAAAYGIDPNAVRCKITEDDLAKAKMAARDRGQLRMHDYGPRSRREMLGFLRSRGGMPG